MPSTPLPPSAPTATAPALAAPRRRWTWPPLLAGLLACWLAVAPVAAQELDLYEGEVRVDSQDAGERAAALPRALAQVFGKLTGDADAARDPLLSSRLADAQRLMQQFRYRQDVVPEGAQARVQQWLIVRFDPAGVDQLLAEAGRAVWPTPRPAPLLWLAIDDGRGPRLVSSAQAGAVSTLTTTARNRGLRIEFPLLDLQDQSAVRVEDVWNGQHQALVQASARYQSGVQLVGRLLRTGSSWQGVWTLIDNGQALSQWRSSDVDPLVVLAAGANGAADALTERYAVPATSGAPGEYVVELLGIDSAEEYLRATAHLGGLGVVRELHVVSAGGDRLRLRLVLGTGLDGLQRVLQSGRVLEMLQAAEAGAVAPGAAPGAMPGTMPSPVAPQVHAQLRLLP